MTALAKITAQVFFQTSIILFIRYVMIAN